MSKGFGVSKEKRGWGSYTYDNNNNNKLYYQIKVNLIYNIIH